MVGPGRMGAILREPTNDDITAAERALYRVMHIARLALHAMENVELVSVRLEEPQQGVMYAVESALGVILREAEASGDSRSQRNPAVTQQRKSPPSGGLSR